MVVAVTLTGKMYGSPFQHSQKWDFTIEIAEI